MTVYNYCDPMPLSQVVLILSYYIHTVAGIVIAPSIIIIVIISLVICVAVLFVRSRSKKSDLTISAGPQVHTLLSCITCVVLPSNVIKFMIHIDITFSGEYSWSEFKCNNTTRRILYRIVGAHLNILCLFYLGKDCKGKHKHY